MLPCSLCKGKDHSAPEHVCSICKATGHRGRDCPLQTGVKPDQAPDAPCVVCKSSGHATKDHQCSVCKGFGHRGRACPVIETEGLPGRRMELFHMTSEDNCRAIISSKRMLPGSGGMFGAGIYFCDNKQDCLYKARSKGVTLRCLVQLGRSLICKSADSALSMTKVRQVGCTSIKAPGGYAVSKTEYAVYEPWQVLSIQVDSYHEHGVPRPLPAWPAWALSMADVAAAYRPEPAPAWAQPTRGPPAGPRHSPADPRPALRADRRPRDPATGVPIAASTGLPDRRYKPATAPARPRDLSGFVGSATRAWNHNPSGPLTRAGLPDMRFSANFAPLPGGLGGAAMGGPGSALDGFVGSASHAWNGNVTWPMTKAGLPDMRFKCNRL